MMINKNGFVKSEALFDSTQDSKFYKRMVFLFIYDELDIVSYLNILSGNDYI